MSASKKKLDDGSPCLEHRCILCCKNTEMPLSRSDVERLLKKGYKFQDFAIRENKETRLKNVNGYCYFLHNGRCVVYSIRPEGCKLYPLVFNEEKDEFVFDELCPYHNDFIVSKKNVNDLMKLILKLDKERKT
ncbi:YkgJ family cysteine cluster protein [Candidatus Bathyarchaeota archaeon]|nr:YkgJ family cysteine cluster protein [Candidatus Bathyarchaeota archaeon]